MLLQSQKDLLLQTVLVVHLIIMLLAIKPHLETAVQQAAIVEVLLIIAAIALAIQARATHQVQQLRMVHVDHRLEEPLVRILRLDHAVQFTDTVEAIQHTVVPETAIQVLAKILVTSLQMVHVVHYSPAIKLVPERNSEPVVQLLDIVAAPKIIAGQVIAIPEPAIVLLFRLVLMVLVVQVRKGHMFVMVRSLALAAQLLDIVEAQVITVQEQIVIRGHVQLRDDSLWGIVV